MSQTNFRVEQQNGHAETEDIFAKIFIVDRQQDTVQSFVKNDKSNKNGCRLHRITYYSTQYGNYSIERQAKSNFFMLQQ